MLCGADLQLANADSRAALATAKNAAELLTKAGNKDKHALALSKAAIAALTSTATASEGFELADQAVSLYDGLGDVRASIPLKIAVANAKLENEAYVEAEDWAEDAQAASKKSGDLAHEAESAQVLATVRLAIAVEDAKDKDEADTASATEASRDALLLFRKLGDRRGEAAAMHKLAQVRYQSGAGDMAKMAAEEAQNIYREIHDTSGEAAAVLLIAHVQHKDQQLDGARQSAQKAFSLYQSLEDAAGMESCSEFLEKVKVAQTEQNVKDKAAKKTVSDTGLVKLVNSVEDSTHLLSYFADMNEDEDTELGEFDLKEWGNAVNMLKIQA
jgi:tetratricopeptide (TPR) repeat protein